MAIATEFAKTKEEADARFQEFRESDPLRRIPKALISSAEISDYVRATGMLYPFYEEGLKSASYEAHVGGKFIFWDEEGHWKETVIKKGDSCVLPRNSITFVQVEPKFRIPNYMALRFNLRITLVHRGLLLGTGPLIDPGFVGKLVIPVHNLTDSDYELDTEKALIWIEFTKTAYGASPRERHVPFPEDKKNLSPEYYLHKAGGGNPIRSSIGGVLREARQRAEKAALRADEAVETADKARSAAERLRNVGLLGGFIGLAALFAALAGVFFEVRSLTGDSIRLSGSEIREVGEIAANNDTLRTRLDELRSALDVASKGSDRLLERTDDIDAVITTLVQRLERLEQPEQEPPETQQN